MHKTELGILGIFKRNPYKELSTSEIISSLFPEEMQKIEFSLADRFSDKSKIRKAKQEKAKLHRQLLHHLNKLLEEDILYISSTGEKGEKRFLPNIKEGEELTVGKYKKKVTIAKLQAPSTPIEGYEQENIVARFEGNTWHERINSVLIECQNFSKIEELQSLIIDCLDNVNDAIALNNFEILSSSYSLEKIKSFMASIAKECEYHGKNISCIIDLTHPRDNQKFISWLESFFAENDSKHIRFVFDLNSKELNKDSEFFSKCVEIFSKAKANFYVKNQALYNAPYFIGVAGPYTFDEKEWHAYKESSQKDVKAIVCSHAAVAIDVKKFFESTKRVAGLPNLCINISKSLLKVNTNQKLQSDEIFKKIIKVNGAKPKEFFSLGRNYIRLWNYGWKEKGIDTELILDVIKLAKASVNSFCASQETIAIACGMPMRFRVVFSCAFKRFDEKVLGGEKFHKIVIKKLDDLYSKEIVEMLEEKESIFDIFDGGDRIRFFRDGMFTANDVKREIGVILNTYKLPFFCYDFGRIYGNLKLSNFIKE